MRAWARRVVQLDRRAGTITDEDGVRTKYGVDPASIPDWLALVGDSADGFPGLAGWGKKTAAVVLAHYGHIAAIPDRAADWEPKVVRSVRGAATLAARLAEERATGHALPGSGHPAGGPEPPGRRRRPGLAGPHARLRRGLPPAA